MISKHTKILFLVAIVCIGTAVIWQKQSEMTYERSHHASGLYSLNLETGAWQTNRPDGVPLLLSVFRVVGTFALLLAIPLLVNDITHRRQRR